MAVLDANVLYPGRVRDLLFRLAIAGHYQARWTERILDECFNNLVADRPDIPAERLHRTRRLMNVALPDAIVRDYDHLIEQLDLPDPSDRHVLAAAMGASADVVVTSSLGDLGSGMCCHGLRSTHPTGSPPASSSCSTHSERFGSEQPRRPGLTRRRGSRRRGRRCRLG